MSHSSGDDSDEEMKPMRMKIGPTSYITKRNSGLAVSEASDPHDVLPDTMVNQNDNLTTTSKQLLEPSNITGVSNDDLMISESKSRIGQSPFDNNLSINNTSMIQNFMMDKDQIDLTSADLKLTGAPRPKKSAEPDEKIDVDWTMDLPALNITRQSNLDQKSKNDVTDDFALSQIMKTDEVDQEQDISDFDEDEAGEKVFKFNIDV
jgi:hypothetical protein